VTKDDNTCACEQLAQRVAALEDQIGKVHQRNTRVETDKAWETSRTRLASLALITYLTMVLILCALSATRPLRDALIPTTGFLLSTLSLPFIRRAWESARGN